MYVYVCVWGGGGNTGFSFFGHRFFYRRVPSLPSPRTFPPSLFFVCVRRVHVWGACVECMCRVRVGREKEDPLLSLGIRKGGKKQTAQRFD